MQFDPLRRREFITLLGGAAAWPLVVHGAGLRARIAVLSVNSVQDERKNIAAFVDGLSALGYVASQNIEIDYRYAEGDTTRLKPLAQELIALKPTWLWPIRRAQRLRSKASRRTYRSFVRRSAISSCRVSWRTMRGRVVA